MHGVSELYGRFPGSDIYIVGTGASIRVFPVEFLRDKITIGLNQAWRIAPVQYGITIRPELNIAEFMGVPGYEHITWVTKFGKFTNDEQRQYALSQGTRFYNYSTDAKPNDAPHGEASNAGRDPTLVEAPRGELLYLWSSISQSAVNLAAHMGAKNIFLVGCDNCSLSGNHHAHQQHLFWKGTPPDVRYQEYEDGLAELRPGLRKRGINLLNLTPFISLKSPERDFLRLCKELGQPEFVENEDITGRVDPKYSATAASAPRVGMFDRLRKLFRAA